ncbi:MAG: response regulator [Thermodesulfobacteriota bacterium]|nr:response regulator [Thermodesulfobacteriota bacterium]
MTINKENNTEEPVEGTGKILLMDDEEKIRDVTETMLDLIGYEMEFAGDGREAIDLYLKAKGSGDPFDAVIMDLTVKDGMGGEEAVKKLLEIDPEAKIIISSGYPYDPIVTDFREYGFAGAIVKPFRIKSLDKILREVIMGMK